jgi:hypothetical protein
MIPLRRQDGGENRNRSGTRDPSGLGTGLASHPQRREPGRKGFAAPRSAWAPARRPCQAYQGTGPSRLMKEPVGPSGPIVAIRTMTSVPSVTV